DGLYDLVGNIGNFVDDGKLKGIDQQIKYWFFELLCLGSILPLFASITQMAVVFKSDCSSAKIRSESVILLIFVLIPLISYPLFWWMENMETSPLKKFGRWSLVVLGILSIAVQCALAAYFCDLWSYPHVCNTSNGATEFLFTLFLSWLAFFIILASIGLYAACKIPKNSEERAFLALLLFLFTVIIALPLIASAVQVAALKSGNGCDGPNNVTSSEAIALLVLVALSTIGWAFACLPSRLAWMLSPCALVFLVLSCI
ncbi:hypothetical protein RFI_15789, partial [Reticulomyxa filosa]